MSSVAARLEARAAAGPGSEKQDNATVSSLNHASASTFLASFEEQRRELECALSALAAAKEASVAAGTADATLDSLKAELARVNARLASLQADTNSHAHLITAYDVRSTKLALAALDDAAARMADTIVPKKKFAFRKKTAPAAAAATAAPAAAADASTAPAEATSAAAAVAAAAVAGSDAAPTAASSSAIAAAAASLPQGVELPPEDHNTGFFRQQGRVLVKSGGTVTGVDVMLTHLRDCVVVILDSPSALRCHNLHNCIVFVGPVTGSTLIYGARDCAFHITAKQLRIHDTHASTFHLRCLSSPIIEHTDTSGFGPCEMEYPLLEEQREKGGFAGKQSRHEHVEDFNWLRAQQSPNWHQLSSSADGKQQPLRLTQEHVAQLGNMLNDDPVSDEQQQRLKDLLQSLGVCLPSKSTE